MSLKTRARVTSPVVLRKCRHCGVVLALPSWKTCQKCDDTYQRIHYKVIKETKKRLK